MAAMMAFVGCSEGNGADATATAGRAGSRGALLAQYGIGERDVLRVKTDLGRGRLWVLGLDSVYVYEFATRRLLRKLALPGWSVSRFDCSPDLALDSSGAAWVSSNVQPRLWRIDGGDFGVSERAIRMREREHWDVGFGALAFAADGTLLAMTATAGGQLWKIDPRAASGNLVDLGLPAAGRCEFPDLLAAVAAAKSAPRSQLAGK